MYAADSLLCDMIHNLNEMKASILLFSDYQNVIHEPRHDKTNKMACAPSEDSDQPGHQNQKCLLVTRQNDNHSP